MKQQLTSESKEQAEELSAHLGQHQTEGLEFDSVESLVRYDSAQTSVPPELLDRVLRDLGREPAPPPPWWKRWFRK